MFDGEGFVRGMIRKRRAANGASALLVGCGGVGSAIAASLAKAGSVRLGLYKTNTRAIEELATRLCNHYPELQTCTVLSDPKGYDCVVNATPLGMNAKDPMPLDIERIHPGAFVGEIVLTEANTTFLNADKKRSCLTQIETDMLFVQIPAYLEFFAYPSTTVEELRSVARLHY